MKKRIWLIVLIALLSLAADQATKVWARNTLRPTGLLKPEIVELIPNYLHLQYHENPGIVFGLARDFPATRYVFIVIGIGVLIMVGFMVRKVQRRQTLAAIAFALVAGGALGNVVDRIYIGRVVDFIVMHWQRKFVWPAYNVADASLVAGIILLMFVLGQNPEISSSKTKGSR